jgi:type II secretion system protein G
MNRSYPLTKFSVGSVQCSVGNRRCLAPSAMDAWQVASKRYQVASHVASQSACRAGAAFTLVELLVVVAIIAILAGLTLSTLGYVNKKGAESRAKAEVAALSTAIDNYKTEFGSYPASNNLYSELTGRGDLNSSKMFFEPSPGIVSGSQFVDPWGSPYKYTTNPTVNVGFFDLWTEANEGTNESRWIRN